MKPCDAARATWLDELDELRGKNLYRPLRVMTGAAGRAHDGRRPAGDQPLVEQLPRPDDPSAPGRGGASTAVRELGVGTGAVRTIAGATELIEELERRLADFKHVEAVLTLPVGPDRQQRHDPGDHRPSSDLIVSDELNHASIIDGVRLSKASRAVFPHRDVDGLEKVLREARAQRRPERRRTARSWSSPTASSRWTATSRRWPASATWPSATRRRSWSTTPTRRACSAGTAAARSTTSTCTVGSTSRSARSPRRSA